MTKIFIKLFYIILRAAKKSLEVYKVNVRSFSHSFILQRGNQRALVASVVGTKNPRERLGSMLRLSTLANRGGKII